MLSAFPNDFIPVMESKGASDTDLTWASHWGTNLQSLISGMVEEEKTYTRSGDRGYGKKKIVTL